MPEVVLPEDDKTPKAGSGAASEHNIPAPPKNRPLEMKDYQAIGVFENAMPIDVCKAVIGSFEEWHSRMYIVNNSVKHTTMAVSENGEEIVSSIDTGFAGEQQFPQGSLGRKDTQLFLETHDKAMALAQSQW